jgi:hypothetical protein
MPKSQIISDELYREIRDIRWDTCYLHANHNCQPCSSDGKKVLSHAAMKVLQKSPAVLICVVEYLRCQPPENLDSLRTQVAKALGITGWKRDDYVQIEPGTGL